MKQYIILLFVFAFSCGAIEKPNIVWLVSEDNSKHWLKLYNESGVSMPNIETLAKQGLVFNNAFSCAPVCSVARSTLISGCYAPRLGVQYHRRQFAVPMPDNLKMFPWYLRKAGYYTTNCSKQDYNFNSQSKKDVWDESSKKASYKNRQNGQPFFHVQNFGITHEGQLHFKELDSDKVRNNPDDIKVFPYHPDTSTFKYSYAVYHDRHRTLDDQIGNFIDQLKKDNLLDNTFIFYYGDHGGALPRSKGYCYESGLHVPLVVYIPEKWRHLAPAKAGSRIDGFVQFVDYSATVLNLAGVSIPEKSDGKAFLGKGVSLKELNSRDTAYGYADRFDEKYDLVRTVRKGKYKYIRNFQPFNYDGLYNRYRYYQLAYKEWLQLYKDDKLNKAQKEFFQSRPAECLYDLETDPHEVNNLAKDPLLKAKLVEMRNILKTQLISTNDLSFFPEPVWINKGGANPEEFGMKNKSRIVSYLDTADLILNPIEDSKVKLSEALNSKDPWQRYWALITCASYGSSASIFKDKAITMAEKDPELLVRVRAAEFLGLACRTTPTRYILDALSETDDKIEAALIMNSVVLLRDLNKNYSFDNLNSLIKKKKWKIDNTPLGRRLEYLLK